MTQGRCVPCGTAYRWSGAPLLKDAACPRCARPLERTTQHLKRAIWKDETPRLRKTDGKGYLSAGDAREAAAIVRERVYPLAEALKGSGFEVITGFGKHAVTLAARRRAPQEAIDAYLKVTTCSHDPNRDFFHTAKAWITTPTEEEVDRVLAAVLGHVSRDIDPRSTSSYSGGDWVRNNPNNVEKGREILAQIANA